MGEESLIGTRQRLWQRRSLLNLICIRSYSAPEDIWICLHWWRPNIRSYPLKVVLTSLQTTKAHSKVQNSRVNVRLNGVFWGACCPKPLRSHFILPAMGESRSQRRDGAWWESRRKKNLCFPSWQKTKLTRVQSRHRTSTCKTFIFSRPFPQPPHRPCIFQPVSINTSSAQTHQHVHTQAPVSLGSTVQHRPLSYRGQANSSNTAGALHGLGQRGHLERTFWVLFSPCWFLNISKTRRDWSWVQATLSSNSATNKQKGENRNVKKIQHNDAAQQSRGVCTFECCYIHSYLMKALASANP